MPEVIALKLEAIRERALGGEALDILNIIAYLAPDNIHTRLLSGLVADPEQFQASIELLNRYLLIRFGHDKTVLSIEKPIQDYLQSILVSQNNEVHILKKTINLLLSPEHVGNPNNIDHFVAVWGRCSERRELIVEFGEMPSFIYTELSRQLRYEEADAIGPKAVELLSSTLGEFDPKTYLLRSRTGIFFIKGT